MEILAATAVASTALQVVGNIRQGEAAAGALNTQADWSRENARWAREDADRAREDAQRVRLEGYAQEDTQRRGASLQLGRMNAALAQSGVDIGSGSALRVAAQSATFAEYDALNMRYSGLMRAYGIDQEATGFEREAIGHDRAAAVNQYNARQARYGGYLGAGTSVLNSIASYYKPRGY